MKNQTGINLIRRISVSLIFTITLFLFSKSSIANDTLGIKLDKILFFESGENIPDKANRTYIGQFKPESKYISIEFNLINLKFQSGDQEHNISFVWKQLNGNEFGKVDAVLNIKSEWEKAYISKAWGWAEKGNWPVGRMTVQIFIDGNLFAEKDFIISPYDDDFYSFPNENKEIEELRNSSEIKYHILQQYKIDTYFNSFYKIEFSKNGKDIAYNLSQFDQVEDYNTKTTTRNVHLFKNNKQIVPVYFRIDAFFDNDLNNLIYLGMKTTKATYHDVYAYNNGWQLFKSRYVPTFYISPDSKKNTYIWNSMPVLKSSFTWDSAYDYLMINSKKVQPEMLTKAKTINISTPITYIKNQDNSYNVAYTAKYKIDKQEYSALFNETERVSPEFDGYISKPYLSNDEKNIAYIVNNEKKWFVMINDKKITNGYKEIKHEKLFKEMNDEIIFCEEGNNVIYQAKIDGDWYLMKGDEKISDGFSRIESITLSPDEKNISYKVKSKKKWLVYVNKEKVSSEFDFIGEKIHFSPDGNKVAYAAATEEKMFVMINDKQISSDFDIFHQYSAYIGKSPLAITDILFNKDGGKVAYMVNYSHGEGDLISHNEEYYIMINDIQISPKMYSTSIHSNKTGEFYYAGIDISNLVLHHVKIEF